MYLSACQRFTNYEVPAETQWWSCHKTGTYRQAGNEKKYKKTIASTLEKLNEYSKLEYGSEVFLKTKALEQEKKRRKNQR